MARHDRAALGWQLLPLVLVFVVVCTVAKLTTVPALAGSSAEAFVQQNVDKGITILKDKGIGGGDRREAVRKLLTGLLDTKKIGLFALGAARDKAPQPVLDAYVSAFNDFMIASYVSRLDGYGGQSLNVTGSVERAPGDFIVTAVLVDPSAPTDPDPVKIMFRVLDENGTLALVDASIAGVWLGLAQRDDFGGYLSQHQESIPALTAHLQAMTASFNAQTGSTRAP